MTEQENQNKRDAQVFLGRILVKEGWLRTFREELGVSANVVAGWMRSNSHHVGRLERAEVQWVQERTAQRVSELHDHHGTAVEWLKENGLTWAELETLRGAAHRLGIAVSTLRARLAASEVLPIAFGPVLGEWIEKAEAEKCRR